MYTGIGYLTDLADRAGQFPLERPLVAELAIRFRFA
jgi:hypothetical protein